MWPHGPSASLPPRGHLGATEFTSPHGSDLSTELKVLALSARTPNWDPSRAHLGQRAARKWAGGRCSKVVA